MRDRRITSTCFRTCSTCLSRSQAPLCAYTLPLVSNQGEGTFVSLCYSLGGDRPSQTAHQAGSSTALQRSELDVQNKQGGISTATPPRPEPRFRSLPPILRSLSRTPLPSYSKGSRGLSVLVRVPGIFTQKSISLSPWSRQRGSRYTIRAGRNLPDKEFRAVSTTDSAKLTSG